MFKRLLHSSPDVGSRVSVFVDTSCHQVKRVFEPNPVLVNGKKARFSARSQEKLFLREIEVLKVFEKQGFVPNLLSVNFEKCSLIQEYFGPDLLIRKSDFGWKWESKHSEQLCEIYDCLYSHGWAKRNGSLSNMTVDRNNNLVLFDFKWSFRLSEKGVSLNPAAAGLRALDDEIFSVGNYLAKADAKLPEKVLAILQKKATSFGEIEESGKI
jgi:serine/threonine protein kinase